MPCGCAYSVLLYNLFLGMTCCRFPVTHIKASCSIQTVTWGLSPNTECTDKYISCSFRKEFQFFLNTISTVSASGREVIWINMFCVRQVNYFHIILPWAKAPLLYSRKKEPVDLGKGELVLMPSARVPYSQYHPCDSEQVIKVNIFQPFWLNARALAVVLNLFF